MAVAQVDRDAASLNLVIHIGFHKTGTSSLQAYCNEHYEALAAHGVLYPQAGRTVLEIKSVDSAQAGHRKFQPVLTAPTSTSATELLDAIIAEAKARQCHTVLLSSETFSAPRNWVSEHCAGVLARHFKSVRVLAYLRRQDDWASSFYREMLCWPDTRLRKHFNHFCQTELLPWLDFNGRLERWEAAFGRDAMLVRSYNDRLEKDIVKDVFRTLDLDVGTIQTRQFDNPSLPLHMTSALVRLNGLGVDKVRKSALTREMFRKLADTKDRVVSAPLVSSALLDRRDEFASMNKAIIARYGMPPSPVLAYGETPAEWSEPMVEPTLGPDYFKPVFAELAAEKAAAGRNLKLNHDGRWGMSVLCNENLVQTASFIEYHLALGASRIMVFLDNPTDRVADCLEDDRVEYIPCDRDFWFEQIGRLPESNFEKLHTVHQIALNHLRGVHELDWALNIDADELIWVEPGQTVAKLLADLGRRCNMVQLFPREAVFVDDADSDVFGARYFKVLSRLKGMAETDLSLRETITLRFIAGMSAFGPVHSNRLKWFFRYIAPRLNLERLIRAWRVDELAIRRWSDEDEAAWRKAMPKMIDLSNAGFLGHTQGRVILRKGLVIDQFSSHSVTSVKTEIVRRGTGGRMYLLHFDAVDYDAWHLKWYRRIYGDAKVFKIGVGRQKQQDMFKVALDGGTTEALFRDLFFIPKIRLERLLRRGLVARMELPSIAEIVAKWRRFDAASHNNGS